MLEFEPPRPKLYNKYHQFTCSFGTQPTNPLAGEHEAPLFARAVKRAVNVAVIGLVGVAGDAVVGEIAAERRASHVQGVVGAALILPPEIIKRLRRQPRLPAPGELRRRPGRKSRVGVARLPGAGRAPAGRWKRGRKLRSAR